MYKYNKEHNRQQADDWLWDTIPNTFFSRDSIDDSSSLQTSPPISDPDLLKPKDLLSKLFI